MTYQRPTKRTASNAIGGLDGTFNGSCVVCRMGTDTGLGFVGDIEFGTECLVMLGVPEDRARAVAEAEQGVLAEDGQPDEELVVVRVCEACAKASGAKVRVGLLPKGVPIFREGP